MTLANPLLISAPGAPNRALSFDVEGLVEQTVRVVGIHWVDRWSKRGVERVEMNPTFWRNVRSRWEYPESKHFVVLGDLNESPYDRPIVSKRQLWAIRDGRDLGGKPYHDLGQPALYNPMWRFLLERAEPPFGTYEKLCSADSGVRWWLLDQIIVSKWFWEYVETLRVPVGFPEFPLAIDGYPQRDVASDHLPVVATLKV